MGGGDINLFWASNKKMIFFPEVHLILVKILLHISRLSQGGQKTYISKKKNDLAENGKNLTEFMVNLTISRVYGIFSPKPYFHWT